jgi:hypothetical protein
MRVRIKKPRVSKGERGFLRCEFYRKAKGGVFQTSQVFNPVYPIK